MKDQLSLTPADGDPIDLAAEGMITAPRALRRQARYDSAKAAQQAAFTRAAARTARKGGAS